MNVLNPGGVGSLEVAKVRSGEGRSHKRKSVLSELGELVVVTLGTHRGLLLNLSTGGMLVQAQNPITVGIQLPIEFLLPSSDARIHATCEAVWSNDNCEIGLRFLQLTGRERLALEDWMAVHGDGAGDMQAGADPEVPYVLVEDDARSPSAQAEPAARVLRLVPPAPPLSGAGCDESTTAGPGVLQDVLLQVVAQAHLLTSADGAALVLRDKEAIVCRASIGNAPELGSRLGPNSGLSGECFRVGQVVCCDDAYSDPRVNLAAAQRLGSRSILIAPILGSTSPRGVLQVLSSRPFAFNASHVAILQQLTRQVASFLLPEDKGERLDPTTEVLSQAEAALLGQEHSAPKTEVAGEAEAAGERLVG